MPRGNISAPDQATLQMALVGYEIERQRLADKISEIRSLLGPAKSAAPVTAAASKKQAAPNASKKRVLSASARARIAAAQRKRWAEHHKKMGAAKA